MCQLTRDQAVWNDADDSPAGGNHRIGEDAHQTDIAAAVDGPYAATRELSAK
jgi:hypothetical protein